MPLYYISQKTKMKPGVRLKTQKGAAASTHKHKRAYFSIKLHRKNQKGGILGGGLARAQIYS